MITNRIIVKLTWRQEEGKSNFHVPSSLKRLKGQHYLIFVFGVVPEQHSGVSPSTYSHICITAVGQEKYAETAQLLL